jgi:predicted O-methyltransferase YrrM
MTDTINLVSPYDKFELPVGPYDINAENEVYFHKFKSILEYGEKQQIYRLVREVNGGHLINLGDCEGGSAAIMAQSLIDHSLDGHVHTVDVYTPNKRTNTHFEDNVKYFESLGLNHRITMYKGFTADVGERQLHKLKASLVFVDGGHTYRVVRDDWRVYNSIVAPGGLIAFHDTNQEDIDRVIREYVVPNDDWALVDWVNRIKVFKKKV